MCSAVGFNAESPALEVGYSIRLWFAIVLAPLGNEDTRLAILNDGVISMISDEKRTVPCRTAAITFKPA